MTIGGPAELALHVCLHIYEVCAYFFLEYLRVTGAAFVAFCMLGVREVNGADARDLRFARLLPVKYNIAEPAYGNSGHGNDDKSGQGRTNGFFNH